MNMLALIGLWIVNSLWMLSALAFAASILIAPFAFIRRTTRMAAIAYLVITLVFAGSYLIINFITICEIWGILGLILALILLPTIAFGGIAAFLWTSDWLNAISLVLLGCAWASAYFMGRYVEARSHMS
ncbi:hypothetical protein PATSB16_05150 [Pandoraea thiooxydans]|uniref:Uncharacterized protein n=1 Tax=Pandoraea thiooxydans TaxID=445709 RepID=A0A0G3ENT6_9BURK|nr:hypothetical protein [Pandoraea thiooxydans]AKJ66957.1 hypothetical protein ABW99_00640 [Pandoraea thiooxydans]APR93859.1 hypothetical protein PATSB16_05150 [Pandoraea thiooxydans]